MNGTERIKRTLLGLETDRQPIYGWVSANLSDEISAVYGSVPNFEDKYEFDCAHIFGGPSAFSKEVLTKLRDENDEVTPDIVLDSNIFTSPNIDAQYKNIENAIAFHKKRGRFCYVQTPGFFEQFNSVFGIENQLLYMAMYPDELNELYKKQAEWTKTFADKCIARGADMVHFSDDWGAQNDMMFSPKLWREIIFPNMKTVVDHVHEKGVFASLHSDGCVIKVADGIAELGYDVVHPWQENAGMSYDIYLKKYADRFAILGGVCVQSAIGLLPKEKLESEIRRVFEKLRGRRWICCTTHYVQKHCSVEDLTFAYDLIYKLARA